MQENGTLDFPKNRATRKGGFFLAQILNANENHSHLAHPNVNENHSHLALCARARVQYLCYFISTRARRVEYLCYVLCLRGALAPSAVSILCLYFSPGGAHYNIAIKICQEKF